MPELDADRQARLKEMLMEQKRRMWNELREDIFRNTAEPLNAQFEIPQDPGEQSMLDFLEDLQLSVVDIRRQQLTQLDEAVSKLERGTYGICEECGEEINEERLKIMPFANRCRECQEEKEGVAYPPESRI
ncbi:TraR/DksA C4-type zinc finger protein [Geobacter sp. DSM 9736]|uniref:TraR/DksA family transcriptional regulator n=1 Tax=Geobacter sp. DSM 9736 TaxID=1277350 RepID=UPI000B50F26E|nr:TraR/DksA C4-type zinc finger protein [Geobacter sp. DSM 9736]SNB46809.1 transcriptional regulator, TraR/DksA family [Geobacter sp. DSM 9736]